MAAARVTVTCSSAVISVASLATISEVPPRAKKSSSAPTRTPPSSRAMMPATAPSAGVRCAAATSARPASARPGARSAARSTLPLGVNGSAGSTTIAAGTM